MTRFWVLIAPLCIAAAFALRSHAYIFQYLPYFLMGIAAFQFRRGELGRTAFVAIAIAMGVAGYFIMGGAPALAGLLTALAIGFLTRAPRPLIPLGSISCSLYLIHVQVGDAVGSPVAHGLPAMSQLGTVMVALVSSLLAAWILYRFVERPSRELAGRVKYKRASNAR